MTIARVQHYQDSGVCGPADLILYDGPDSVRAWSDGQTGHPWDGVIVSIEDYGDEYVLPLGGTELDEDEDVPRRVWLRSDILRCVRESARLAFDDYLGGSGAAVRVPDCVQTAAVRAAGEWLRCHSQEDIRVMGRPTVRVVGRGNPTHPVCYVDVCLTFGG